MLPKQIGDIAESACITRLLMLGYRVLFPFGEYEYDLVYYDGKTFVRAQVKTALVEGPSICFPSIKRTGGAYTEVDVFLVFHKGRIFCVPFNKCGHKKTYMNLGRGKQIHLAKLFADDYELLPKDKRWLNSIKRE